MKRIGLIAVVVLLTSLVPVASEASVLAADVRLTNDAPGGGYVSAYTIATGQPYSDAVLDECSVSRGRQNEPAVAIDPRNRSVLVASANDYCGVYAGSPAPPAVPVAGGPEWLGYYRSESGGQTWVDSLVPGYPGDSSPFASLAHVRTASAGDPVIGWDNHGRVFMGSESSGDPSGTTKTFGDVWVATFDNPSGPSGDPTNDGKSFERTVTVAQGSSSPGTGKFNDKTALEVDRTGGACDGNVYFGWSRFSGSTATNSNVYLARSTDHGATWSSPKNLTPNVQDIQFPSIAVTGDGNVYVVFRKLATSTTDSDAVEYVKSTDCGRTFGSPHVVTTFLPYDPTDVSSPQSVPAPTAIAGAQPRAPLGKSDLNGASVLATSAAQASDCGDYADHCASGYTFFRSGTAPHATADQSDGTSDSVFIVLDATKPGTQVPSGTTFGSVTSFDLPSKNHREVGSQSGIYFVRLNGTSGAATTPMLIDPETTGHQIFPAISADAGTLHAIWWDSRNDPSYSPTRPIGNDASGGVNPALDVYGASSIDAGATWTVGARLSDVTTTPDAEQFGNRAFPFAGDYLWVTSVGTQTYAAWADWRNTVAGSDPREGTADDADGADVLQCRTFDTSTQSWSGDTCPHKGGLDENIYGDLAP